MIHFAIFGYVAAWMVDTKFKFSKAGLFMKCLFIVSLPWVVFMRIVEHEAEKLANWMMEE